MERAYVFFSSATSESIQTPGEVISLIMAQNEDKKIIFKIAYSFKNHGRTPAIINAVDVCAAYVESGFPKKVASNALPLPLVISGGESIPESSYGYAITGVEHRKAKAGDGRIFFWGTVAYQDVFEASHETSICAQWSFSESRFVISKCKQLNYYT